MKTKAMRAIGTVVFLCMMLCGYATVKAAPGDKYDLTLKGTYYYSKVCEMLPLINIEREKQGADPLVLDVDLTERAMIRAAECAVDFSHTRPDGRNCFSIGEKVYGENIAAGNTTAAATFAQWMNSAGHRANMMNSGYKSIGIGCYSWGGGTYWVQLFSFENGSSGVQKGNVQRRQTVSILEGSQGLGFNLNMRLDDTLYIGSQLDLDVCRINPGWDLTYCKFTDDSFVWSSSDNSVASVDALGRITAKNAGKAVIRAVPKNGASAGTSFSVTCKASVEKAVFSEIPAVTYNGKAFTPNVTVSVNGRQLVKGTDYTISYSNNVKAGTAKISITGKGHYTGKATTTFVIEPNVKVKLSKNSVTYNGRVQKPSVKVTSGKKTLKKNSDYTVSYKNNKKAGIATAIVKGKGNYKGFTKTLNFKILPKRTSISSLTRSGKTAVIVRWKRNTQASGYEIQISTQKKFKTNVQKYKMKKNSATKYTFSNLKNKTYYYVRVRAYKNVSGQTLYSSWSGIKKLKTK